MKKTFRGSMCAYCSTSPAATEDHVIGRNFFPKSSRDNLPKVPACAVCNARKSNYERYAMAVFPFGSVHDTAQEILHTKVRRRLEKDQRLHRRLRDGQRDVVVANPDGSTQSTIAIPFDYKQCSDLFAMIIKGLLWHHFRSPLPGNYIVRLFPLTDYGLRLFKQHILSLSPDEFEQASLADGAFKYEFTRNPEDPFFSAWVLDFYDSLNMCGVTERGRLLPVHIAALTGPPEVGRIAEAFKQL